jgi:hypothetical protein
VQGKTNEPRRAGTQFRQTRYRFGKKVGSA